MLIWTMTPNASIPSIFDMTSTAKLERMAKANDPSALKSAARQFEALFLQMVLKSMRDATPQEGLFDSEQTRFYQSLLDQQLGQVLANSRNGTGLAALIEKQLARSPIDPDAITETPLTANHGLPLQPKHDPIPLAPAPIAASPIDTSRNSDPDPIALNTQRFVNQVWPHAVEASRSTRIPPAFLIAQAALETGWGRAEPQQADGSPSYNVFGIKAGAHWTGKTVTATTTEFINGKAETREEKFRAYGSYAEGFRDYANLLLSNPRYAAVVGANDSNRFAQGLARAGYATDPAYADKLARIIGGRTLRTALQA